ncbi:MAG: VanZ family protein [Bacteroidales bacterium]
MSIFLKRIIFFTYLLLILIAAFFPFTSTDIAAMNNISVMSFRLDHILHVIAFFPFYPLFFWLFRPINRKLRFVLLVTGLFLAAAVEFLHFFIEYRAFNPADLIANLVGVLLGTIILFVIKK